MTSRQPDFTLKFLMQSLKPVDLILSVCKHVSLCHPTKHFELI